jgi:hypothetical protein
MRRRALAAALLLAGCTPAPGKLPPLTPPTSERDVQADYAARFFMESCVAHIAKPGELTRWIRKSGLHKAAPDTAAKILREEQGEVWSVRKSVGTFFLIVVPINENVSKCSVWAERADAARLTEHFERLLQGTVRPGLEVAPISDRTIQAPGSDYDYRQLVYFLHKDGADVGFVFIATTSASEQAEIQGRLTVSPGRSDKVAPPDPPAPTPAGPR